MPVGWRWVKLGGKSGVADIVNGSTPSTDEPSFWNGDILWATPTDLGNLRTICLGTTERKITQAGLDSCSTKLLPIGTVLLTSRAPIGNLAITSKAMCTNQGFKSFIPNDYVHSLYLYFALKYYVPDIIRDSHLNTFAEITKESIQNFDIPLPPTIDEQILISAQLEHKLAEIDKMRQAALRRKEAINAMQGALLKDVFPWKEGDQLPQRWQWHRLRDVSVINPSPAANFERAPDALTSYIPMEAVDGLSGKITQAVLRKYSEIAGGYTYFETGDVIFAKITPCMQNGKSAIAENLTDGIGFGSTEFHVLGPKQDIAITEWIYYFVRTNEFKKQAEANFDGSAGQKRVPRGFMVNSLIPIPTSTIDQSSIVCRLSAQIKEIERSYQIDKTSLESIEALSGAVLREVFDFESANRRNC